MENFSSVIHNQKRKKIDEEFEFHNSIQDWVFTIIYWLQKSAWKYACTPVLKMKNGKFLRVEILWAVGRILTTLPIVI